MSIFMNYDGIIGESNDQNHKGWIDIKSMFWGVGRSITSATSTRGDRESSNATITDLQITRNMDSATPRFFIEACCGTGKRVILHLTKTGIGDGSQVFMEYILDNALISNYSTRILRDKQERPVELLTISFVNLESRYTPYDESGNALAPISVGFDTASNSKR